MVHKTRFFFNQVVYIRVLLVKGHWLPLVRLISPPPGKILSLAPGPLLLCGCLSVTVIEGHILSSGHMALLCIIKKRTSRLTSLDPPFPHSVPEGPVTAVCG